MNSVLHTLRAATMAALCAILTTPASAQVPNTLKHSIPPPFGTAQTGGGLGFSVAVDGTITVAGAPYDDTGATDSGIVKVFDSSTGVLLFVIPNPSPAVNDSFGNSVAISGTRVVVGASRDETGGSDAGSAYVYDLSSGNPTVPVATLNNPSPAAYDNFGAAVSISGTRVVVAAPFKNTGVYYAGSVYVYDLSSGTPIVPVATLNSPTPGAFDYFGISVAISGTRVVVGAKTDDQGVTDAGSVHVYDLSGGTPTTPVVILNNPNPTVEDQFGYSVAISGTRVVVSAPFDDMGASDAGSAYVYDLAGGTPTVPVATLSNPSPAADDRFGWSVAISGTRVVVSAPFDDTGAIDAGSVYLYDLNIGTPMVPVATLTNPSLAEDDRFGISVAISGTWMVAGADRDDTRATNAGSAYVFDLSNGTPTVPWATLNDPGPAAVDYFGYSVAISGTLAVVGAARDNTGDSDAGSVYVYDLSSGIATVPVTTLNNPSPSADDQFGYSVGISGTRLVVGAPFDDTGSSNAGSVYVYDLSSGTPTVPVATLNNPSPSGEDRFGSSVAISGTRVVVGAYNDDTGATNSGSAYVYDLSSGTPTVPVATLSNPSPSVDDNFGISVAISGARVVVGAYQDDKGASNAGSAYVYNLNSGSPMVPAATLNNPSPAATDNFGFSVAISGARVVVGAHSDDTIGTNTGSAYVYDVSSGTPTAPIATLNNPFPLTNSHFGWSVAISGTRVVAGTPYSSIGVNNAGMACMYDLSSSTPTVSIGSLFNPAPSLNELFGFAVAIDGMTVAIGTPWDGSVMASKGYAYVFGPASNDFDNDGLLDIWEYARFGSISAHSGMDDSDGDGRVELLEEAFNTNPLLPDVAGAPQAVDEGGYLTMTIAKRAGVTYSVQSAATPDEASFSAASTTVLVNDATTLKVRDNVVVGPPLSRFMRVKVTAAP